tara:strand:- start:175 stop:759 length:585 start_codon:yes stop_codon:yes gene_type:complete
MEGYYNLEKINEHSKLHINQHARRFKDDNFNEKHFNKNKSSWQYDKTLDINNPEIKEYMIKNLDKFRTMCLVNIYHSQKIKTYNHIFIHEFDNLFKDYLTKYIDNTQLITVNKQEMINRNLTTFDIKYNLIFKECKKKHRYSQKCKLKKEYLKYLECGDIEQCNLKDLLYMIIYAIDSGASHSAGDSASSGVET